MGRGEDVSDEAILRALRKCGPRASTAEVMERLPIKRNQTLERLKDLQAEGKVTGYKFAGAWVWSAP